MVVTFSVWKSQGGQSFMTIGLEIEGLPSYHTNIFDTLPNLMDEFDDIESAKKVWE